MWGKLWGKFYYSKMDILATSAVILDKRSQLKDGTFPLKLRITYNREKNYLSTGLTLSEEDWIKVSEKKARGSLKEVQIAITAMESKANEIIAGIGSFTFKRFKSAYLGLPESTSQTKVKKSRSVFDLFVVYITDLKETGRAGTASSYNCAYKSLAKFSTVLYFEDITPAFLNKYEQSMLMDGNSLTTIGIYLRSLRAIYNLAIEKGIVKSVFYPFGKRMYQIPKGANTKKAITHSDVQKIANYTIQNPNSWEEQARDLWMLSYLCNGMNIKDICNLKYENIDGDKLTFIRQKTERNTRSNPKPIVAFLPEQALEIIRKWAQPKKNKSTYLFPFYTEGMDAEQKLNTSNQVIQNINKWMKKICTAIGIEVPVTTYTARHTFSTVLKRSGASTEYISESLGHSDLKTTENYLASFDDDTRREMSKFLLG